MNRRTGLTTRSCGCRFSMNSGSSPASVPSCSKARSSGSAIAAAEISASPGRKQIASDSTGQGAQMLVE